MNADARTGCPRWVKIILLMSMTVNFVVAGVLIGNYVRSKPYTDGSWMLMLVPEAKRPAAQEMIAKRRPQTKEIRLNRQENRRAFISKMTAEEFDAKALAATLAQQRELSERQRALIHEQLIELLSLLSPQERVDAARRMQEMFQGRRTR